MKSDSRQKAESFLEVASKFQLGDLPTEQRHPLTYELADLSRRDIPAALVILKEIDLGVVSEVASKAKELARLESAISKTLQAGHRVFSTVAARRAACRCPSSISGVTCTGVVPRPTKCWGL